MLRRRVALAMRSAASIACRLRSRRASRAARSRPVRRHRARRGRRRPRWWRSACSSTACRSDEDRRTAASTSSATVPATSTRTGWASWVRVGTALDGRRDRAFGHLELGSIALDARHRGRADLRSRPRRSACTCRPAETPSSRAASIVAAPPFTVTGSARVHVRERREKTTRSAGPSTSGRCIGSVGRDGPPDAIADDAPAHRPFTQPVEGRGELLGQRPVASAIGARALIGRLRRVAGDDAHGELVGGRRTPPAWSAAGPRTPPARTAPPGSRSRGSRPSGSIDGSRDIVPEWQQSRIVVTFDVRSVSRRCRSESSCARMPRKSDSLDDSMSNGTMKWRCVGCASPSSFLRVGELVATTVPRVVDDDGLRRPDRGLGDQSLVGLDDPASGRVTVDVAAHLETATLQRRRHQLDVRVDPAEPVGLAPDQQRSIAH